MSLQTILCNMQVGKKLIIESGLDKRRPVLA